MAVVEQTHSQLFTLRVWVEYVGNGRSEIRGILKHVLTGEIHHFRNGNDLSKLIESLTISAQDHLSGGKT